MSYLTLDEAAQYSTAQKGFNVEPSQLLRAGVHGALLVCAPFGFGAMHNATTGQEEDFRPSLLVIPPSHLLEIETDGVARIGAAHSLDGKSLYFPYREITREKLRVTVSHLDSFLKNLVRTPEQSAPANAPSVKGKDTTPGNDWREQARAIADRLALEKYQRGEREITARNTCDAVAIELAKDSTTHGIRGQRVAGSIRNEALKGWKFIPPTGTNGTSGTRK